MFRLLLVDDEKMALVSSMHSFPWDAYGFDRPIAVGNPHEALALLRNEFFDAVFIDIRMPELSGIDIIQACRAEEIAVEFVVLSGYSDFEYARSALQLGALDYCLKPVLPDEAAKVLSRLSRKLYENRCDHDMARIEALHSTEELRVALSAFGIQTAGNAVLLAAMRTPQMERALKELPKVTEDMLLLASEDTLVVISTDYEESQRNLTERYLPEGGGLCYCIAPMEDLEPGKQIKRLLAELENTSPETPVLQVHMREVNRTFAQLLDYVDAHFSENLTLQTLAETFHLNYTYCSELFKEMAGQTFTRHLTARRMQKAKDMINRPEMSLSHVALSAGYKNYHHFAATFKAYYGKTPTDYRQSVKEKRP